MNDHIIKAAKEADPFGEEGRLFALAVTVPKTIERFYAIAFQQGMERAAEICDNGARLLMHPSTGNFVAASLATTIRAHAQNQPKNGHDGSVVSKN